MNVSIAKVKGGYIVRSDDGAGRGDLEVIQNFGKVVKVARQFFGETITRGEAQEEAAAVEAGGSEA